MAIPWLFTFMKYYMSSATDESLDKFKSVFSNQMNRVKAFVPQSTEYQTFNLSNVCFDILSLFVFVFTTYISSITIHGFDR
jgi:hypothetical protein